MDDKSKIGLPHPLFLLGRPQFDGDMGKMGGCIASKSTDAADEIKQLRARVQELEAMLDAVGAGGVSAQRVTQAADHIEQPLEMVAAPAELNLDDYYCKGCGRIGEIEELNAQDKEKLRKIEGKPKTVAAPVALPEPAGWRYPAPSSDFHYYEERRGFPLECKHLAYEALYTEQQVRDLLAAHRITQEKQG